MSEENNYTNMDQNEFMKRMKAIASDLWGGIAPAEEEKPVRADQKDVAPAVSEKIFSAPEKHHEASFSAKTWSRILRRPDPPAAVRRTPFPAVTVPLPQSAVPGICVSTC